jgi:hypothetical protein
LVRLHGGIIKISDIIKLVDAQLALINFSIFILDKKQVSFEGEDISIEYSHEETSVLVALILSLGSSVETIKSINELSSMRYKDALPISRSVIETCINVSYILAVGIEATKNSIDHAITKGYRKLDVSAGSGNHKISVKSTQEVDINEELADKLEKFSTKKGCQKDWTELSVPKRIAQIEKVFGSKHATSFSGAYLMTYSDASEVIHGSYFGSLLASGMQPFGNSPKDISEFNRAQERNMESSLLSSFLSMHAMLCIFSKHFNVNKLEEKLSDNFKMFSEMVVEDSE